MSSIQLSSAVIRRSCRDSESVQRWQRQTQARPLQAHLEASALYAEAYKQPGNGEQKRDINQRRKVRKKVRGKGPETRREGQEFLLKKTFFCIQAVALDYILWYNRNQQKALQKALLLRRKSTAEASQNTRQSAQ